MFGFTALIANVTFWTKVCPCVDVEDVAV